MTQWHLKSKTKPSGGVRHSLRRRDKRRFERGSPFTATRVGEKDLRVRHKARGHCVKQRLRQAASVVVCDPAKGTVQKASLVSVAENTANRQYTRQNILTRGALVQVKAGQDTFYARITSRPGQHGVLYAVPASKPAEPEKKKKKSARKPVRAQAKTRKSAVPSKGKGAPASSGKKPPQKPAP